jgi:heptosyltransferase-1
MTPPVDLRACQRLLIIRLSSIGDVLHALPVSAALGRSFPHLEITWVVEEMAAEVVTGNPYLKDVIILPRKRWKTGRFTSPQVWREYGAFLKDIRARRFDITLDLQGYAKSAFIALASGARHRYGWRRLRDGSNLVSRALPTRPESMHRVEWFLDTAYALGATITPVEFPLAIPDAARERAQSLTGTAPYIVINPAAGNTVRRWGATRYGELVRQLPHPAVLIGTPRDAALNAEIVALSEGRAIDLAGQTNLKELAAVLEGCVAHVCGDTGSAHLAAALGKPVIALYGPTDPTFAGPWAQAQNVLSHRHLCIAGCGEKQCAHPINGVAACLAETRVAEVTERLNRTLNTS